MKKWIPTLRWLLIIFIVLWILSTLKDLIIKTAIEWTSPDIIGAKIEMGSFSLGLLTHQIHINNFKMYNPPGFPNEVFLDMPEVRVQVDIPELIKGKMYFPQVILNMQKMIIFKNKDGKLNVDSIKIIQEQQAANKGKPLKLPVFKIDTLDLNLGKVIMEDYSHAPPVHVAAYDVGIKDQKIYHINGLPKLMACVIVDALKPTAIRSAGLIAAEAVLGVGFLPGLALGMAVAQDDVNADFNHGYGESYQAILNLVQDLEGTIKSQDNGKGLIFAKVYGCDIVFTIQDKGWGRSNIKVKARQYLLPKLEIANGLLYQLSQRLR